MENQKESKLLNYIDEVIGEPKKYLKVSELGNILTEMLGTNKTISGESVNFVLEDTNIQQYADDEFFKFLPTGKFKDYKKEINKKMGYGLIKWHYSIILLLLNINYNKTVSQNAKIVLEHLEDNYIGRRYIIDTNTLEETLQDLLIVKK